MAAIMSLRMVNGCSARLRESFGGLILQPLLAGAIIEGG